MTDISFDHEAEWRAQRCGMLTASRAVDVCKRGAKGNKLSGYETYMNELIAERLTGEPTPSFCTSAMQWGIDHEDDAAKAYEIKTGNMVTGDGKTFVKHPTIEGLGASPDRFVGEDGIVEIKCPACGTHLERLRNREIPEQYKWQILTQLIVTGRKWCDYVDYDPRFRSKGLELLVIHWEPTDEELNTCKERLVEFLAELNKTMEEINTLAA